MPVVFLDDVVISELNNGFSVDDFIGYVKNDSRMKVTDMPSYAVSETVPTSDLIMRVEGKRKANQYTGNELAGIGTLHKSNSVPIRKDSNDAVEIARMRRG